MDRAKNFLLISEFIKDVQEYINEVDDMPMIFEYKGELLEVSSMQDVQDKDGKSVFKIILWELEEFNKDEKDKN